MVTVQSIRGVGCKRGYPYFATGLYRAAYTRAGKLVWKLVRSGDWRRSTSPATCGSLSESAPFVANARHNQPVTPGQLAMFRTA